MADITPESPADFVGMRSLIAGLQGAAATPRSGLGILSVLGQIWLPGLGAALSSVGFGAIAAFSSLLFAGQHWSPVWLPFSAYAFSIIIARLALGHLPDRIGGARVAIFFALIETVGLAAMGFAANAWIAAIGAALTGFGYSLVFPALGVEAVHRAPSGSRGVAMGAYTACLDLALGVSGPVLGAIGGHTGLSFVFLASAISVLCSAGVAAGVQRRALGLSTALA